MADRFADRSGPECSDRDATSIAAFHGLAHCVGLRERARQLQNVVLAPVVARSLKRPHVERLGLRVNLRRIEAMLLHQDLIDLKSEVPTFL